MPIESAIETLETICPNVIRQGSMAPTEAYPDRFFTYWVADSADQNHYDNAAAATVWEMDVNYYSIDPLEAYSVLAKAKDTLQASGWIISGKGHDVASDVITHQGRGFTALYLET